MAEAGRKLRRIRERLRLKYRDIEEASHKIAQEHGNPEFVIGLSRLADIENKDTVPSVFRIYSICAIYGLPFSAVLGWYGVEIDALAKDAAALSLNPTRPVDFKTSATSEFEVPIELDSNWDVSRTSILTRQIQRWGKLPLALLGSLDRRYRYGLIGENDWSMYPVLTPGSFVQIDESKRRIATTGWSHEHERPIYFVEHRNGYRCGWCTEKSGFLMLHAHSASTVTAELFRYPGEADVIGQIVGVAMRLDLAKRRHTRS